MARFARLLALLATLTVLAANAVVLAAYFRPAPIADGGAWRDYVVRTVQITRAEAGQIDGGALWLWSVLSVAVVLACGALLVSTCQRYGVFDGYLWFGLTLLFTGAVGGAWMWLFWEAYPMTGKVAVAASWATALALLRLTVPRAD